MFPTRIARALIVLTTVSLELGASFAPARATVATRALAAPTFSTGSFDTTTSRIPLGFAGHDIRALCRALEHTDAPQGALETTDAYLERLQAPLADQRLFGFVGILSGLTPLKDEELLGLQPETNYDGGAGRKQIVVTYDPDSRQLSMWPYDLSVIDGPGGHLVNSQPFIELRSIRVSRSSSIMQNAFGTEVKVTHSHVRDFGISPTNPSLQSIGDTAPLGSTLADPSLAERIMHRADRTLMLCRLERHRSLPIALTGENGKEATFGSPSSVYIESQAISVRIESVWLYESRTGEVIARLRPQDDGGAGEWGEDAPPPILLAITGGDDRRATLRYRGRDYRVKGGGFFATFMIESITSTEVVVLGHGERITLTLDPGAN